MRIARGRQHSRPLQDVLEEILERQREGYKEVVLTGVNIGAYGHERGKTLADLVRTILDHTQIPRIRLSSIEPWDLSPELLSLWQEQSPSPSRLCRHLHIPLQSGCNATLRRMKRRYTTAQYAEFLRQARAAMPDLAVTTDVIVGFPGEDEDEFAASTKFVASMRFARIHVFSFSPRPGTAAAAMPDQIPPHIKKKRSEHMHAIARQSAREFQHRFIGKTMDVLWEQREGNRWTGLTDNYIRVEVTSAQDLHNRILPVQLLECTSRGLRGELAVRADT